MVVAGLDISKTHLALFMRDTTSKRAHGFVIWASNSYTGDYQGTTAKQTFKVRPRVSRGDSESVESWDFRSGVSFAKEITRELTGFAQGNPVFVAVEDIAYNKNPIVLKSLTIPLVLAIRRFWVAGWPVRMHDPKSVKLWAGNGNWDKNQMVEAALGEGLVLPERLKKNKANPAQDIADAYFLADLLRVELIVRNQPDFMASLPHNKKQVFNRVTVAYPENLLARDFLSREQPTC